MDALPWVNSKRGHGCPWTVSNLALVEQRLKVQMSWSVLGVHRSMAATSLWSRLCGRVTFFFGAVLQLPNAKGEVNLFCQVQSDFPAPAFSCRTVDLWTWSLAAPRFNGGFWAAKGISCVNRNCVSWWCTGKGNRCSKGRSFAYDVSTAVIKDADFYIKPHQYFMPV